MFKMHAGLSTRLGNRCVAPNPYWGSSEKKLETNEFGLWVFHDLM